MPAAKINVVSQAPHVLCVDDGQIASGESRKVYVTPLIETYLETGALRADAQEEKPVVKASTRSDDSTLKENS